MTGPYIQRAKIISGFPGIGKSHFCNPKTPKDKLPPSFGGYPSIDLETVTFKYLSDGVTIKPEFPDNFISYLRDKASHPGVLMIPQHQEVLGRVVANGLAFTNVYPLAQLKEEYLERYRARGSSLGFVDSLERRWDEYVTNCQKQRGCEHVMLEAGEYLSDRIDEVMGNYNYNSVGDGPSLEEEVAFDVGSLGGARSQIIVYRSSGTTVAIRDKDLVPARAADQFKSANFVLLWIAHNWVYFFLLLLLLWAIYLYNRFEGHVVKMTVFDIRIE